MRPAPLHALLVLSLLAPCAPAVDYFVNAATGNNATGDGSLASPWRTITFAVSQVQGPGDTIHVAAGVYDLALGETYPIDMKPGVSVIGAGFGVTILDAVGVGIAAIRFNAVPFATPTRLEGIRISGTGGPAVRVSTPDGSGITIARCSLSGNGTGLRVEAGTGAVGPTFRQNLLAYNVTNVFLVGGTPGTTTLANFDRNWITFSTTQGVAAFAASGGSVSATFSGDRIETCFDTGLFATASSGSVVLTTTSLTVFHHVNKGIEASATGGGSCFVSIDHATVADNTGAGISLVGSAGAIVSNSIVRGNTGGDFAAVPVSSVVNCVVGPGAYVGQNGNVNVDPMFIDPSTDNFQLQQGSPCIDAAGPGPAIRDSYGDSRPLDGNLDGVALPDVGSDEYAHAHVATTGSTSVGGSFSFVLTGTPGVFIQNSFAFAEGPPLAIPYWGVLFVAPPVFPLGGIAGFPPTTIPLTVPNDPSLLGLLIYIQSVGTTLVGGNLRGSLGNPLRLEIL